MKKTLIFGFLGVVLLSAHAYAYEPEFLDAAQSAKSNLSASAFSAAAQRANPAANVIYPKATTASLVGSTGITKTLARGLKNDPQVKFLQTFLIQKGFLAATADGNFGPKTEAAVKKFQTANGVSPLGIVGPQTRALIK